MQGGYIEPEYHKESSSVAPVWPDDFKDDVVLRVDVLIPNPGIRQLLASQDPASVITTGKASANSYKLENFGLRLENSAKKSLKWFFSEDAFTPLKTILVHTTLQNNWVPATWENWESTLFNDRYKSVLKKMSEIKKLRHNWDSYGAFPLSRKTYIRAIEFLAEVFKAHERIGSEIPVPFVALCPDGSIQLEWGNKNKELDVVIPYSSAEPISTLRVTEDNEFIEAYIGAPSEIERYLSWLRED